MGKRRKARELALQALYQTDFYGERERPDLQLFWEEQNAGDETRSFADTLIAGIGRRQAEIDLLIEDHSEHWKLSRMSRIDRNILRIAVLELLEFPDIPCKVTIDEAIELGKKYGSSESGGFLNGILDQILKSLTKENKICKQERR